MWLDSTGTTAAPDLVVSATTRLIWSAPVILVLISAAAALLALYLTVRDVVRQRRFVLAQERDLVALRTRERRLRMAVQASDEGHVHMEPVRDDNNRIIDFVITDANDCAADLFRRDPRTVEGLRTSALASLAPDTELFRSLVRTIETGTMYRAEVRANPRHVATSWLRVRATVADSGISVSLRDIRDRKREAARLRRASMSDALTGLLNRRGFLSLAERSLDGARAAGQNSALFYLDCNAFKQINDTHGHQAGDRALTEIARALRVGVRETDLVARMGGDEFTILAVDAEGTCIDSIRARITERLDALNASRSLPCPVSVSVGHVLTAASDATSLADLLELADRDLLARKRAYRCAQRAMDTITKSTRPPSIRRSAERALSGSQLTGAVTAA